MSEELNEKFELELRREMATLHDNITFIDRLFPFYVVAVTLTLLGYTYIITQFILYRSQRYLYTLPFFTIFAAMLYPLILLAISLYRIFTLRFKLFQEKYDVNLFLHEAKPSKFRTKETEPFLKELMHLNERTHMTLRSFNILLLATWLIGIIAVFLNVIFPL